jgi:hypothetical protein
MKLLTFNSNTFSRKDAKTQKVKKNCKTVNIIEKRKILHKMLSLH